MNVIGEDGMVLDLADLQTVEDKMKQSKNH